MLATGNKKNRPRVGGGSVLIEGVTGCTTETPGFHGVPFKVVNKGDRFWHDSMNVWFRAIVDNSGQLLKKRPLVKKLSRLIFDCCCFWKRSSIVCNHVRSQFELIVFQMVGFNEDRSWAAKQHAIMIHNCRNNQDCLQRSSRKPDGCVNICSFMTNIKIEIGCLCHFLWSTDTKKLWRRDPVPQTFRGGD